MNFKLITPGYYSVVVTAPSSENADKLVVELVKKGYSVSPGLGNNQIHMTPADGAASIIVLALYSGKEDLTLEQVYKDVAEIVSSCRISIYSTVISEYAPCMFGSTNLFFPKKPQPPAPPPAPPIPPETRKKMN